MNKISTKVQFEQDSKQFINAYKIITVQDTPSEVLLNIAFQFNSRGYPTNTDNTK